MSYNPPNQTVEIAAVPDGFLLRLTQDQARVLVAVLRRVGGDPAKSRRWHANRILAALDEAGIDKGNNDCSGGMTFYTTK